jgi:hypothetical protein
MDEAALDGSRQLTHLQFSESMNQNHHPVVAVLLDLKKEQPQNKIEIQTRKENI